MKICGIYCLTHRVSGKLYVGQSRDIEGRWRSHARATGGLGIAGAIAKYGWSEFDALVLELCPIELLNERERHWVETLGSLSPGGYNLTTGGNQNKQVSDDVRALISLRTIAGLTPEVIESRRLKIAGRPKPLEWRAAMSERQKKSAANTERLRALARNQTAETKRRISESKRGKTHTMSDAGRAAVGEAHRARAAREAAAGIKRTRSPEARARMSAAKRAYWAKRRADQGQSA